MKEPWPIDRRKEMEILMDLLLTVGNINNGSNFIEKLEKSIHMANKMDKLDINTARPSFMHFLIEKAAGDE